MILQGDIVSINLGTALVSKYRSQIKKQVILKLRSTSPAINAFGPQEELGNGLALIWCLAKFQLLQIYKTIFMNTLDEK